MNGTVQHDDEAWPPGTVRLEDVGTTRGKNVEIILQPRPSRDPNDPLNWSLLRKCVNFGLTCLYATMVFVFIDAATPTWVDMNTQLGFSYAILNDSYAIGCGTLCIGAFILIPFALKYGRRPVYIVSTLVQCAIAIWTARIENVADLLLVNALSCGLGALAEVMVQMTVADVFFVHQRGMTNTVYVWIAAVGGQLTPIPAGFITVAMGWRWVWWWCAISFAVTFLLFLFCFEESKYAKVDEGFTLTEIQDPLAEIHFSSHDEESKTMAPDSTGEKSAAGPGSYSRSEEATSNPDPALNSNTTYQMKTYRQRMALWETSPGSWSSFFLHSYQPVMILVTIPAVGYMSFVYGMVNVAQTMTITVLSTYMTGAPYNFNASQIGLMSLPSFIGTTIGTLICGPLSDTIILFLAKRNKGVYEPEMRLWLIIAFIPFVPAGLLVFGLALNAGASWAIVAFGYGLVAFGITAPSSIALTYITDAYTEIVADSLVGVTFTRNIVSTILVFAITPWIQAVGIAKVFITISVLLLATLLGSFGFLKYGKRIRTRTAKKYRYYASRQFQARSV